MFFVKGAKSFRKSIEKRKEILTITAFPVFDGWGANYTEGSIKVTLLMRWGC